MQSNGLDSLHKTWPREKNRGTGGLLNKRYILEKILKNGLSLYNIKCTANSYGASIKNLSMIIEIE